MINLVSIGHTRKAHGKDGFIKLTVDDNFVEELLAARAVFIDLDGSKVPFILESAKETHEIFVKLEGINDPEDATKLASKEIYLHEDEAPKGIASSNTSNDSELLNFTVLNQEGVNKGLIVSIIENPHQLLAEIKNKGGSFMAPIHEDLIIELNEANKTIQLEISEGLEEI